MSMLEEMMDTLCVLMNKVKEKDGQGGWVETWVEGDEFEAAVKKDTSMVARVAEKQGVTEVYTITFPKELNLEFHDVFKRKEDGAVFRVTSNSIDSKTPDIATFSFGQVTAERWELPSG